MRGVYPTGAANQYHPADFGRFRVQRKGAQLVDAATGILLFFDLHPWVVIRSLLEEAFIALQLTHIFF